MLNTKQIEVLLRPINGSRIFTLDGMSHLAAWDVRAHLNRIFGFGGWSGDVLTVDMIYDLEHTTAAGKPARKVAYRVTYRLTIAATGATYTEAAVGESIMPVTKYGDCHDMALKTAESQALKRCAINLGDQFGISLYAKGSRNAVVLGSVAYDADLEVPAEQVTPDHDEMQHGEYPQQAEEM